MTETDIRATLAEALHKPIEVVTSEAVRAACHQLRDALVFYFLYTRRGVREDLQVAFPAADDNLQLEKAVPRGSGRWPRTYHLATGICVHNPTGAASFWHPHFLVGDNQERNGNAIVFTEPLAFRDTKNRFFIRHLDVNELDERSPHDRDFYVAELVKKVPWVNPKNLVLSRGYVPGAEVLGKDGIWKWLSIHAEKVGKMGHMTTPEGGISKLAVSWDLEPSGDPKIAKHHRILLGSARANSLIRMFQKRTAEWMPYRIENEGIRIRCDASQINSIEDRIGALLGAYGDRKHEVRKMVKQLNQSKRKGSDVEVLLSEDWTKVSFALVSREIGLHSNEIITVICANQGRSIQELGEKILTTDQGVMDLRTRFGIKGWFPRAFQIVFAMALDKAESRVSNWTPLLYRSVHAEPSRPEALRHLDWPAGRITPTITTKKGGKSAR